MELSELVPRFMALFAGLNRAYGSYQISKKKVEPGEKVTGRALTKQEPVTEEVWRKHLEGAHGIGIVPVREDGTVRFGVIDVDIYPLDLEALERNVTELKLPLVIARTKSGGAHLILFCAEDTAAKFIRSKLTEWAVLLGYPGVEIFPKQDDVSKPGDTGNWINMPYSNARNTLRYGVFDAQPLSPEEFLQLAEGRRVTRAALEAFTIDDKDLFNNGPPCLQHLAKVGFPRGTRNRGLFNLGVLARFSSGDDWRDKVEEFNRQYMQPPLSSTEVVSTNKSLARKIYFYTCSQDPIASVCSKEICRGRKYGIGNADTDRAPVVIDNITEIKSKPPVYVVVVEGVNIQCSSQDLLNQINFRRLVLESNGRIIPMLKASVWEALVNEKLDTREVVIAPDDSGAEGKFLGFLEDFCTTWAHAKSRDEILLGKPWLNPEDGYYYFRSKDFEAFLEHQKFRLLTGPERWEILRRNEASSEQRSIKGTTRNVWRVPSTLFTKQTEGHAVPPMAGEDI